MITDNMCKYIAVKIVDALFCELIEHTHLSVSQCVFLAKTNALAALNELRGVFDSDSYLKIKNNIEKYER